MTQRMLKIAVSVAIAATLVVGVAELFVPAQAAALKGCICPAVYAPVTCSNGRTYSNSCVASCNHATGCHPSGTI